MIEPEIPRVPFSVSLAKHPDILELVMLLADPHLFVSTGEPDEGGRLVMLASPTRGKIAIFTEGEGSYSLRLSSTQEQG